MRIEWKFAVVGLAAAILVRHFDKKVFDKREMQLGKMRAERDALDHMLFLKNSGMNMDIYLKRMGYQKVGIYGLSILGNHLYEELHQSEYVSRLIGIDKSTIYNNYDMEIYKPENDFNPIDLIIVTVLSDYENIASKLKTFFSGKIISIQQLINECETLYFSEVAYCEEKNGNFCDLQ